MIQSGSVPRELLGQLVAHRLLALDAVRLLQRRDVVPAVQLGLLAGHPAGVGDEAVHQRDAGAVEAAFVEEGLLGVARQEDLAADAGGGGVGRGGVAGVAGRRQRDRRRAERAGAGHRGGLAARLERVGRIERLVLDEQALEAERCAEAHGVQQRREPLAEGDRRLAVEQRQQLAVAPHGRGTIGQALARPRAGALQIVAGEQRHAARRADVVPLAGVEGPGAARHTAFEM